MKSIYSKQGLKSIALIYLISPLCGSADVVQFSTGDFESGEWTSHITSNSTGTSVASTVPSGGSPDAYRRVSLTVSPFQFVQNNQLWENAVFDPSIQGKINSVSLSYDVTRISTTLITATQVAKGIAVRQDGIIYSIGNGSTIVTPPSWESVQSANLVSLFPEINWVNGNVITFGFYDAVGTSASGFTINGGYDNFSVSVDHDVIPEPGTLALTGSMLGSILFLRRQFSI